MLQLSYLSRRSGVDLQGLFHGRAARTDYIRPFRRLEVQFNPHAPISCPEGTIQECYRDPTIVQLHRELAELRSGAGSPGQIESVKKSLQKAKRSLTDSARARHRDEFFETQSITRFVKRRSEDMAKVSEELPMRVTDSIRAEAVDLIYCSKEPPQQRMLKVVRAIKAMCLQDSGYPCAYEECERYRKPFRTGRGLSEHIARIHNAGAHMTKYPCPYLDCHRHDRPFNTKPECKRHHTRIHGGEGTFLCPYADCPRKRKPFKVRFDLTLHKRQVHGAKDLSIG